MKNIGVFTSAAFMMQEIGVLVDLEKIKKMSAK